MTFIAEFTDEACGMVRYGSFEIEAESLDDAKSQAAKISREAGPGWFVTSIKQKP